MTDNKRPAQSPALCQFCEESDEIIWLCYHCELYLCETCNNRIHSKMKKNQDHKAISLRNLDSKEAIETRRKVDLENMTCEVHKDQKCVSFCLDCHVTLCLTCHDNHKDHNKKELIKLYDEKVVEIQKVKQDIDGNIPIMDSEETKLTKSSQDKLQEYKKVKDDISKIEADVISEVKKYSQKLYDEVDQVYQPIVTEIQNNLSEVKQMKGKLKEKRDFINNILYSHQARDVLDSSETIVNIPVPQKSGNIPITRCLFTPGDSLNSKVRQIFGEVNTIPELKLVNTYQTELDDIENVINWNQNEKIISRYQTGLQRVRFDSDALTVIKEAYVKVYDMALMENGDVVISSDGSKLKIYTKEGTIKPYKCFSPLFTCGVYVNKHNELLVGLADKKTVAEVRADNITKVVLLQESGELQHTYQFTRNKQTLFTWPSRIITCQDIICVVDSLNKSWEGRVVALDYGGRVHWIYNGDGNKSQTFFYPFGIAVTTIDQIIIADDTNHAIHVLNPKGQAIVCHQVKDLGMASPLSLCIDSDGLLWVGCNEGRDDKAKIHTMTII